MARIRSPHTPRVDRGALLLLALVAAVTAACDAGDEGAVTLIIDQAEPALDPLADPRVTRLALYDDDTGLSLGDAPLAFGGRTKLTAMAPGVRNLRLEALSATSQVLAAARAFDVQLSTTHSENVALHLRKPLAYLGGGTSVQVADTSASDLASGRIDPIPLAGVRAMTTTRSGGLLVAAVEDATGTSLVWSNTSDHVERGRVPLGAPVRNIVAHHHDRFVAVLQTLSDAIVLVDIEALMANNVDNAFRSVTVPRPHSATFDENDNLWVVSSTPAACKPPVLNPGSLIHIDLDGNQLETPVPLPDMCTDVGRNPVSGNPLIGLACDGKVMELKGGSFVEIAAVNGLGDVVIDGRTLYAVGWETPETPDYLPGVVSVLDLEQAGSPRTVTFPIESVPLTLGEKDGYGNYKYLYIKAVSLEPRSVSVTPHGGRLAFLHKITYHLITDYHDPDTGTLVCNRLEITLQEDGLTLVDVETGQIVWTRPTAYQTTCDCDNTARADCLEDLPALDGPAYTPTSLTVLTGGK